MRLHAISYIEYEEESYAWRLENLELGTINLVVGKNSSGKSRILKIIDGLARLIDGQISPAKLETGHYVVTFSKDDDTTGLPYIHYEVEVYKNRIKQEKLIVDGVEKLSRGEGGRGWIWFEKQGAAIEIQIPQEQLAVTARRDNQQHSFFEPFYEWSARTRLMLFQSQESKTSLSISDAAQLRTVPDKILFDDVVALYKRGLDRWGRDFSSAVLALIRKVGFDLEAVGVSQPKHIHINVSTQGKPEALYIIERGIDKQIHQADMSGGLFGALATIVRLVYVKLEKKRHCLLLDDVGEGLDFERSSNLIELIIEENKRGFQQLIMTTNDRFVMNRVDVEYWCVVERAQGMVKVFNAKNTPEAFSEFKEFGFMNFDFFAKGLFSKSLRTDK